MCSRRAFRQQVVAQAGVAARRSELQDAGGIRPRQDFPAGRANLIEREQFLARPRGGEADGPFRRRLHLRRAHGHALQILQENVPIQASRLALGFSDDETASADVAADEPIGFEQGIAGRDGGAVQTKQASQFACGWEPLASGQAARRQSSPEAVNAIVCRGGLRNLDRVGVAGTWPTSLATTLPYWTGSGKPLPLPRALLQSTPKRDAHPHTAGLRLGVALLCVPVDGQQNDGPLLDKVEPQVRQPLKDLPEAVVAETSRLVYTVSPLSSKGLLSQQIGDALDALLQQAKQAPIVGLRAFVAGSGDTRRVRSVVAETFTARHLPMPVLTVVQAGALPGTGVQIVIEATGVSRQAGESAGDRVPPRTGLRRNRPSGASDTAGKESSVGVEDGSVCLRHRRQGRVAGNLFRELARRSSRRPPGDCDGVP